MPKNRPLKGWDKYRIELNSVRIVVGLSLLKKTQDLGLTF